MNNLFEAKYFKMSVFEILAMAVVLLQVWYYGEQVLMGPIFGLIGCVMWIILGVRAHLYGLVCLNLILSLLQIKNLLEWLGQNLPLL